MTLGWAEDGHASHGSPCCSLGPFHSVPGPPPGLRGVPRCPPQPLAPQRLMASTQQVSEPAWVGRPLPAVLELGNGGRRGEVLSPNTASEDGGPETEDSPPREGRWGLPSVEGSRADPQPLVFPGMLLSEDDLQDRASWPRRPWVEMTHYLHVTPQLPLVPRTHFGGREVFILGKVFLTPADVFLLQ